VQSVKFGWPLADLKQMFWSKMARNASKTEFLKSKVTTKKHLWMIVRVSG
jgi:hypothetical protein